MRNILKVNCQDEYLVHCTGYIFVVESFLSGVGDYSQTFYDAVIWLFPSSGSNEVCAVIESFK